MFKHGRLHATAIFRERRCIGGIKFYGSRYFFSSQHSASHKRRNTYTPIKYFNLIVSNLLHFSFHFSRERHARGRRHISIRRWNIECLHIIYFRHLFVKQSLCCICRSGFYERNWKIPADRGDFPSTALAHTEIYFFRIRSDRRRCANDIKFNL